MEKPKIKLPTLMPERNPLDPDKKIPSIATSKPKKTNKTDGLSIGEREDLIERKVRNGNKTKADSRTTELNKEIFLLNFRKNNCAIAKSCQDTGVSRSTYTTWMKSDSEFYDEINMIQDELLDWCEMRLYDKIEKGDLNAITFILKTKGKSRGYGDDKSTDGVVTINVNIPKPELAPMPIIQLAPNEEQKKIE